MWGGPDDDTYQIQLQQRNIFTIWIHRLVSHFPRSQRVLFLLCFVPTNTPKTKKDIQFAIIIIIKTETNTKFSHFRSLQTNIWHFCFDKWPAHSDFSSWRALLSCVMSLVASVEDLSKVFKFFSPSLRLRFFLTESLCVINWRCAVWKVRASRVFETWIAASQMKLDLTDSLPEIRKTQLQKCIQITC